MAQDEVHYIIKSALYDIKQKSDNFSISRKKQQKLTQKLKAKKKTYSMYV